jgi:hypothetical protein
VHAQALGTWIDGSTPSNTHSADHSTRISSLVLIPRFASLPEASQLRSTLIINPEMAARPSVRTRSAAASYGYGDSRYIRIG